MKIGVIGSIIERPRIQSLFNRSLLGIPGHRGKKTLYRWIFWIPLIFDFMRAIKKDTTMNQTRGTQTRNLVGSEEMEYSLLGIVECKVYTLLLHVCISQHVVNCKNVYLRPGYE